MLHKLIKLNAKIGVSLILFTLLFSISITAQGLENKLVIQRPNYSGTWKLNNDKSRDTYERTDRSGKTFLFMVIEQKLPAIIINYKLQLNDSKKSIYPSGKVTLYTDKRGDDYSEFDSTVSTPTVSEWLNNRLFVTHYYDKPSSNNIAGTQEFILSEEGNTLTEFWKPNFGSTFSVGNEKIDKERLNSYLVYDRVK